jgi:alpha-ketoglutaric semialdehyde dehydrogenase
MAIERHHLTLSKTMTMNITGQLLIGDRKIRSTANSFQAHDPSTGQTLEPSFSCASPQDIDLAATLAAQAFDAYRATSAEQRATFLETIATGIEALGATLIERAMAETGLPNARLMGERGRTTGQLRLFAQVLRAGIWQQATVDTAMPDRQPMRRSDLRMQQIALGPVAVFGASNFPLAFSVAGGDTAAALAAGCPVIVKAHPSHPGTSELVARVIQAAVQAWGFPQGTFSMVAGTGNEVGSQLVAHPAVQAVAFTGSRAGGLALCAIARARHQPIPVYAEMSAINPVFLLPQGLAARAEAIATGFVDSLVLGAGQFCTNPGLVLGIKGPAWDRFVAAVSTAAAEKPAATMLNAGIHRAYIHGTEKLCAAPELSQVAQGRASSGSGYTAQAHIYETTAHAFLWPQQRTRALRRFGRNADRCRGPRRATDGDIANRSGRLRRSRPVAARARTQGRAHPGEWFSHRSRGVLRDGPWWSLPRHLRSARHIGRLPCHRTLPASRLLSGFPGRAASRRTEVRQPQRNLAPDRW